MRKVLIPRHSAIFPSKDSIEKNASIPITYGPEKFETYQDWFYFAHIDPIQRWIHALGMVLGYIIYCYCFYLFLNLNIVHLLVWLPIGVFFYYGSGLISHSIYDKQAGKTTPDHFGDTLSTVHRFNLETLFGTYDKSLRQFTEKYPFVIEAHDLIEIDLIKVPKYIFSKDKGKKYARDL